LPALAAFLKRGGNAIHVTFDEGLFGGQERAAGIVALDDALNALAVLDERKSRVGELRFFGGLSVEETAKVLDVSVETVIARLEIGESMAPARDE